MVVVNMSLLSKLSSSVTVRGCILYLKRVKRVFFKHFLNLRAKIRRCFRRLILARSLFLCCVKNLKKTSLEVSMSKVKLFRGVFYEVNEPMGD